MSTILNPLEKESATYSERGRAYKSIMGMVASGVTLLLSTNESGITLLIGATMSTVGILFFAKKGLSAAINMHHLERVRKIGG